MNYDKERDIITKQDIFKSFIQVAGIYLIVYSGIYRLMGFFIAYTPNIHALYKIGIYGSAVVSIFIGCYMIKKTDSIVTFSYPDMAIEKNAFTRFDILEMSIKLLGMFLLIRETCLFFFSMEPLLYHFVHLEPDYWLKTDPVIPDVLFSVFWFIVGICLLRKSSFLYRFFE